MASAVHLHCAKSGVATVPLTVPVYQTDFSDEETWYAYAATQLGDGYSGTAFRKKPELSPLLGTGNPGIRGWINLQRWQ